MMYLLGGKFAYIGVALVALGVLLFSVVQAQQPTQVTICHATGSSSNPYVQLTVNDSAVDGNGNGNSDHNRNDHQNGEDIIPPGSWDADGRNWDTQGQLI